MIYQHTTLLVQTNQLCQIPTMTKDLCIQSEYFPRQSQDLFWDSYEAHSEGDTEQTPFNPHNLEIPATHPSSNSYLNPLIANEYLIGTCEIIWKGFILCALNTCTSHAQPPSFIPYRHAI